MNKYEFKKIARCKSEFGTNYGHILQATDTETQEVEFCFQQRGCTISFWAQELSDVEKFLRSREFTKLTPEYYKSFRR